MLQRITVTGDGVAGADVTEARMEGSKFYPEQVMVAVGGSVVWTNKDSTKHDAVVNKVPPSS
ncbi:MAG: hypothetical protein HY532_07020 [Chloroflexi bacterium]|nr:hypothetical protein [Chloroflexota bacterium]